MTKYKAALIILARKLIKARGADAERAFLAGLTPEDAHAYSAALPVTWLPIDQATRILVAAANVLFPNDPLALRKLGREEAKDNLTGVYRMLLNLVSISAMMQQSARMWRTYHDHGQARSERNEAERTGLIVVEGYPELPEASREIFAGFLMQALEMAKLQNVRITRDDTDPAAWKWNVSHD